MKVIKFTPKYAGPPFYEFFECLLHHPSAAICLYSQLLYPNKTVWNAMRGDFITMPEWHVRNGLVIEHELVLRKVK